jgi:formylglycine-generating enzyme required for sulfatase activity
VEAFDIDRRRVTCAQYLEFVRATAYSPPGDWVDGKPPAGRENEPTTR